MLDRDYTQNNLKLYLYLFCIFCFYIIENIPIAWITDWTGFTTFFLKARIEETLHANTPEILLKTSTGWILNVLGASSAITSGFLLKKRWDDFYWPSNPDHVIRPFCGMFLFNFAFAMYFVYRFLTEYPINNTDKLFPSFLMQSIINASLLSLTALIRFIHRKLTGDSNEAILGSVVQTDGTMQNAHQPQPMRIHNASWFFRQWMCFRAVLGREIVFPLSPLHGSPLHTDATRVSIAEENGTPPNEMHYPRLIAND